MTEAAKIKAEIEDRIDENGILAFEGMGYSGRLPNSMIAIYKEFKSKKDKLQPGRLTPEGYAFVATLAEVATGKLKLE